MNWNCDSNVMYDTERDALLKAVHDLDRRGLVSGSSGNVSMRLEVSTGQERYLVTPSGVTYDKIAAADMVVVDSELEPIDNEAIPSTESQLHLAIYEARNDINAVVHTHSLYATVAAVTGRPIPPVVDEMVVYIGGRIEVADYAFPGSEELAVNAAAALGDRKAVLLRNHGLCIAGTDLDEAVRIAVLAERVAQVFVHAEITSGASTLPADAIEAERAVYLMRSGIEGIN